jgi:hypothetical protein
MHHDPDSHTTFTTLARRKRIADVPIRIPAASLTLAGATVPFTAKLCGDDVPNAKPTLGVTAYEHVAR